MNLFLDWPSLATSGYLFRIVDTRDSVDRVTVLFSDGTYLACDRCGGREFSQSGENLDPAVLAEWCEPDDSDPPDLRRTIGEDLTSADLSEDEKAHILRRVNEAWRDFLADVAARSPAAVAPSAEHVMAPNDGLFDCGGKGLYVGVDGALWIEMDDDNGPRGPFTDPAEALRATLPDEYGLAGPEYHSPAFPESHHA